MFRICMLTEIGGSLLNRVYLLRAHPKRNFWTEIHISNFGRATLLNPVDDRFDFMGFTLEPLTFTAMNTSGN